MEIWRFRINARVAYGNTIQITALGGYAMKANSSSSHHSTESCVYCTHLVDPLDLVSPKVSSDEALREALRSPLETLVTDYYETNNRPSELKALRVATDAILQAVDAHMQNTAKVRTNIVVSADSTDNLQQDVQSTTKVRRADTNNTTPNPRKEE